MITRRWRRISAKTLERPAVGNVQRAYRRHDGPLLVLHRPRSRNAGWYDRIATWAVVEDGVMLRRRHVYGRRVTVPPVRWANGIIHKYRSGYPGQHCFLVNGECPTVTQSIVEAPIDQNELPRALGVQRTRELVGHHSHPSRGGRGTHEANVPTALPDAPPDRLVARRYMRSVLSQQEYGVYVAMWDEWLADHPEYAQPEHRSDLHCLCMEAVFQTRLSILAINSNVRDCTLAKVYHASRRRQQQARENLSATRRQQVHPVDDECANIAVLAGVVDESTGIHRKPHTRF
jgi:hypothetical protein